jgi:hypothetical protein
MKNVIVLLFVIFSQICLAQTGYIRQIADSNNVKVFGSVGFVDQDDNFLYVGTNTTYNAGGYCNGGNGQSFILKIDKLTGATVNSFNVNADTMMTQITDGFYHNNAIYFSGQNSFTPWLPTGSFISKYNLQTGQIEWTKGTQNESHWKFGINSIKFNKVDKLIYFAGNDISNNNWTTIYSGYVVGSIDTLGNNFSGYNMGLYDGNTIFFTPNLIYTNASIELLNSANKIIVSLNEINSKYSVTLCSDIVSGNNPFVYSCTPDSAFTNLQFCKFVNNRLIRVLNGSKGFYTYLTDTTTLQTFRSKMINNLNLKHVTANNNRLFITCVDSSNSYYCNYLINLELDTALNII